MSWGRTRAFGLNYLPWNQVGLSIPGKTNIDLQKDLVRDSYFRQGGVNIHYLEKKLSS